MITFPKFTVGAAAEAFFLASWEGTSFLAHFMRGPRVTPLHDYSGGSSCKRTLGSAHFGHPAEDALVSGCPKVCARKASGR